MKYILPIAITAHNEEKCISKAINSVLSQRVPENYAIKVLVVANACTDRTVKIVEDLKAQNPETIEVISVETKGKTNAINGAITHLKSISENGVVIPYVIFFDADCVFRDKESLIEFIDTFRNIPLLCAISSHPMPDVCFNSRKDIVSNIYRSIERLSKHIVINTISGMCYAIRFDTLRNVEFPTFQIAEDMYLCSRLNGRFIKKRKINVIFDTPKNLKDEIKRRTRQEISAKRYRNYYSHLRKQSPVRMYNDSLGDEYTWGKSKNCGSLKVWMSFKIKDKLYVSLYFLILILAKILTSYRKKMLKINNHTDYWEVNR